MSVPDAAKRTRRTTVCVRTAADGGRREKDRVIQARHGGARRVICVGGQGGYCGHRGGVGG
eukprot:1455818-Rhodomonas_salina.2